MKIFKIPPRYAELRYCDSSFFLGGSGFSVRPIFGFFIRNFLFVVHTTGCFFVGAVSVRAIPNLVRNLFLLLSSLQQILKQVQDDGWTVGWRTFGPILWTDVFRTQQTLHHLWSGGEATTQNSPIYFFGK